MKEDIPVSFIISTLSLDYSFLSGSSDSSGFQTEENLISAYAVPHCGSGRRWWIRSKGALQRTEKVLHPDSIGDRIYEKCVHWIKIRRVRSFRLRPRTYIEREVHGYDLSEVDLTRTRLASHLQRTCRRRSQAPGLLGLCLSTDGKTTDPWCYPTT